MSFDLISRYLTGAWRLMMGRDEGNQLLDYSADGFWNSFFALIVALPPLLLSWVSFMNSYMPAEGSNKALWLLGLGIVDLSGWIVPLVLFAFAARYIGLADRLVPFVVATNWGGALVSWIALPAPLLRLFNPQNDDLAASVGLLIFIVTMFLTWRLINAVLDRGPMVATAVLFATAAVSIFTMVTLQGYFGLLPASASG